MTMAMARNIAEEHEKHTLSSANYSDELAEDNLVAELLATLKEVVTISDRKHNAWIKAHALIERLT
jgi:hypothetical protein